VDSHHFDIQLNLLWELTARGKSFYSQPQNGTISLLYMIVLQCFVVLWKCLQWTIWDLFKVCQTNLWTRAYASPSSGYFATPLRKSKVARVVGSRDSQKH